MKYRTVIFDFDGTLADSEPLMISALNAVSDEFGFAPITAEELPQLRALSQKELVAERLGIPLWRVRTWLRLEKRAKEEFAKTRKRPQLFPGVAEVVSQLRSRGAVVGVVSSGVPSVVEQVLDEARVELDFVDAGTSSFRKGSALRAVLRRHRFAAASTVYVGDELRDLAACKKAGIAMFGVAWGLNSAEALEKAGVEVVSTPEELLRMLINV